MTNSNEKIIFAIDMTNLMYVGHYATEKFGAGTENLKSFNGKTYTIDEQGKRELFKDMMEVMDNEEYLFNAFMEITATNRLLSKGYSIKDLDINDNKERHAKRAEMISFIKETIPTLDVKMDHMYLRTLFKTRINLGRAIEDAGITFDDIKTNTRKVAVFLAKYYYNNGWLKMPTGALMQSAKKIELLREAYGDKFGGVIGCWDNETSKEYVGKIFEEYITHLKENNKKKYEEFTNSVKGTDYKGGRLDIPPALLAQMEHGKKLIEAFGGINYDEKGIESDHILGKISLENSNICIVSDDKDMKQLINDSKNNFQLVSKTFKDKSPQESEIREKSFEETYGFSPKYFADFLALDGDAADNVDGLKGFGKSIIVKLITLYGDIENMIENMDRLIKPYLKNESDEEVSTGIEKLKTKLQKQYEKDSEKNINPSELNKEELEELYKSSQLQASIKELQKEIKSNENHELHKKGFGPKQMETFYNNTTELRMYKKMVLLDSSHDIDITLPDNKVDYDKLHEFYNLYEMKRLLQNSIEKQKNKKNRSLR